MTELEKYLPLTITSVILSGAIALHLTGDTHVDPKDKATAISPSLDIAGVSLEPPNHDKQLSKVEFKQKDPNLNELLADAYQFLATTDNFYLSGLYSQLYSKYQAGQVEIIIDESESGALVDFQIQRKNDENVSKIIFDEIKIKELDINSQDLALFVIHSFSTLQYFEQTNLHNIPSTWEKIELTDLTFSEGTAISWLILARNSIKPLRENGTLTTVKFDHLLAGLDGDLNSWLNTIPPSDFPPGLSNN